MENSIYTVDYFIKKFEPIPEERWANRQFTIGDAHCAQGHCGVTVFNSSDVWKIRGVNKEAEALIMLFQDYIPNGTGIQVAWINNGNHDNYKQPTPKQRILAALYDIYEKTYGRKYEQPAPEPKERIVYVMVDSTVKELSGQLTNN